MKEPLEREGLTSAILVLRSVTGGAKLDSQVQSGAAGGAKKIRMRRLRWIEYEYTRRRCGG